MPTLSTVATVLTSLLLIAVLLVLWRTAEGKCRESWQGIGGFASFGLCSFLIAGLISLIPAVLGKSEWTNFTWLGNARWLFGLYGFFGIVIFGAVFSFLSEASGNPPKLARNQFWVAVIGVLLAALPLVAAGIVQGILLRNPDVPFVAVSKSTLRFLRIATMGDLLLLVANTMLLLSLLSFIARSAVTRSKAVYAAATAEVQR
jgi:cbb3-type cytochrome oxidase subunit 1